MHTLWVCVQHIFCITVFNYIIGLMMTISVALHVLCIALGVGYRLFWSINNNIREVGETYFDQYAFNAER